MLRALELGVRKPLQLRYERLPRTQSEEIRLLFLSDLHLAACRAQSLIRQILTAVEGPAPDLIVLGGDLIDSKRSSADLSSLLHSLRACAPCAAVPGNHDRAYGLPALSALVRECAVHWLPDGPLSLQIRGRRVHLLETAKQLACLEADGATSEMPPTNILIHALCWDLWREYLILGGLPEVIAEYLSALQAPEALSVPPLLAARTLQSRIVQAYESDVAKHSGKVNAMHVVRVLEAIPAQMMRAIEGIESARRFTFKDVVPGIRGYAQLVNAIDWLVAAHLVQRIPIANSGLSPLRAFTQENIFKLYLLDVGVLGALVGLSPNTLLQYEFGTYKGAIAEQYVAQELRASGISGLSCWQEGQSEVEFAIEGSTSSIPIEVKSGQRTMAKSLAVFEKKYAPPVSVVLSGKAHGLDASRRRVYLPIYLAHRIGELR